MRIASVAHALPDHAYDQEELIAATLKMWEGSRVHPARVEALHRHVLVAGRRLALPIERYATLSGFGEANTEWTRVALELGERAVSDALRKAGVPPERVGAFFFVSVTGIATPSIEARLANRIPFPSSMKRIPIFGLGCVAGAAGLARAADYVRAFPAEAAVLLAVELCSLTVQRDDLSVANLIASGLFGDGAAAAVVTGAEWIPEPEGSPAPARRPEVVATRSCFYRDTEDVMGWTMTDRGFRIVLSAAVPDMVRGHLGIDVDAFLAAHSLSRSDIGSFVCHPGGPKVIDAMEETLGLPTGALDASRRSLREVGNLSSVSVLLILEESMEGSAFGFSREVRAGAGVTARSAGAIHHEAAVGSASSGTEARTAVLQEPETDRPSPGPPAAGTWGLLLAMGPGFCSELVLLRW